MKGKIENKIHVVLFGNDEEKEAFIESRSGDSEARTYETIRAKRTEVTIKGQELTILWNCRTTLDKYLEYREPNIFVYLNRDSNEIAKHEKLRKSFTRCIAIDAYKAGLNLKADDLVSILPKLIQYGNFLMEETKKSDSLKPTLMMFGDISKSWRYSNMPREVINLINKNLCLLSTNYSSLSFFKSVPKFFNEPPCSVNLTKS